MQILIDISEHEWEYLNKLVANGDQLGHYERLLVGGEPIQKTKIEQKIREELDHLSTYRVPNSNTDLVPRKAVKRVLNLVFRGHRDKEPKTDATDINAESMERGK